MNIYKPLALLAIPLMAGCCDLHYLGDLNCDGRIDQADLDLMGANLGSGNSWFDLNGDGRVDIFDLATIGLNYGGGL